MAGDASAQVRCLTDLARMGWELHAIATFAGHRSTESTLTYIHLSGRDLADKLSKGMEQIHGWRVQMLARPRPPGGGGGRAVTALTSAGATEAPAAPAWPWPLNMAGYDRRPELTGRELEALRRLGMNVRRGRGYDAGCSRVAGHRPAAAAAG